MATIDQLTEKDATLARLIRRVVVVVDTSSLRIDVRDAKSSKAGGVTLTVKTSEEANQLAGKLKEVIGSAASVKRLTRTAMLLLLNVLDWMEAGDVEVALALADVQIMPTVPIVVTGSGDGRAGTAKVILPIAAAVRLGERGHVRMS